MLIALFILLFVTQPIKGEGGKSSVTRAENQINTDKKQDSARYKSLDLLMGQIRTLLDSVHKQQTAKPENPSNEKKEVFYVHLWRWVSQLDWGTIFLVSGTLAVAWYARRTFRQSQIQQWEFLNSDKRNYALARESADGSIRAYVGVKLYAPDNLVNGVLPKTNIRIMNHGKTPAYDVIGWMAIDTARADTILFPIEPLYYVEQTIMVLYPFNPPEDLFVTVETKEHTIPPEKLKKFRSGEDALFVTGYVKYRDILGKAHKTRFRYIIRSADKKDRLTEPDYANGGNESD